MGCLGARHLVGRRRVRRGRRSTRGTRRGDRARRAGRVRTAYLAVAVTAVAFVLWYSAVRHLGPGRAGLLTGVAPVAAAVTGIALGGPAPRPLVWVGVAVVAGGLALGLPASRRRSQGQE